MTKRIALGRQRRHGVDIQKRKRKLRRQHADDHERLTVDPRGLADGVGGSTEPPLPQAVAQHNHKRRIRPIVALIQQPPGRRRHAEHVERIRRHPRAREPLGDVVAGETRTPIRVRGEARQRARLAAVVDELRQRERRVRIVGSNRCDPDQPVRRRERQGADEHRVDDREHGGRRANRERQSADHRQRETRLADQLTERDAEIVQECVHGSKTLNLR